MQHQVPAGLVQGGLGGGVAGLLLKTLAEASSPSPAFDPARTVHLLGLGRQRGPQVFPFGARGWVSPLASLSNFTLACAIGWSI